MDLEWGSILWAATGRCLGLSSFTWLDLKGFDGSSPIAGFHPLHFCSLPLNYMLGLMGMHCNSILGVIPLQYLPVLSEPDLKCPLRYSTKGENEPCLIWVIDYRLSSSFHPSGTIWRTCSPERVLIASSRCDSFVMTTFFALESD